MKRRTCFFVFWLTLTGCGGLSISAGDPALQPSQGYPVYAPMVLVNVAKTMICSEPDAQGKCPENLKEERCTIGEPYFVPNYNEKYIVQFKPGLGANSGTIKIVDGWMLGEASSNSNASPFFTDLLGVMLAQENQGTCRQGIYLLTRHRDGEIRFEPFSGSPF